MDLQHGTGLVLGKSKGRHRKGRGFARSHQVIERENRALDMVVKGMTTRAIAAELEMSPGAVSVMIRRALEYRAEAARGTVEQARALILERYERLLERWWPLATGDYVDPDTQSSENPPSPRALDAVLKILEAMAKLTGADKGRVETPAPATFTGGIHVHSTQPVEREEAIASVLGILATARQKHTTIEGQLADARTSLAELTATGHGDDRPAPPPRKGEAA